MTMAYKSLLTVAVAPEGVLATVTAAGQIATAMDAHLDGLALGVDRTQVGYSYVGSGAVVIAAAMDRAEGEAREAEAALNAAIGAQSPSLRSSVESVVTQLGALTDVVAARARYSDLTVLPLPYGKTRSVADEAVTEAALFEGMAPVLIVPPSGMKTAQPKRIVVGWNQSREALVAARRALPFLKRADMVQIVVVGPGTHPAACVRRSGPPGARPRCRSSGDGRLWPFAVPRGDPGRHDPRHAGKRRSSGLPGPLTDRGPGDGRCLARPPKRLSRFRRTGSRSASGCRLPER
jgi:hypothetical protein